MYNSPEIPVDWTPFIEKANEPFPLSIFIVYNNMHAALRAAQMIERLGRKFHGKMEPRLQPLPLDNLRDPACFDRALADAASADMIIVSISGPGALPATLKKWMADCTAQKREGDSAVVALLGSTEEVEETDSPRIQFLKNTARAAGLDFFAPSAPEEADAVLQSFEVVG